MPNGTILTSLRWEAGGDPSAHSWWDGGSFHANLAKSTGLVPQTRRYIDLKDAPERVRRVHAQMLPHYTICTSIDFKRSEIVRLRKRCLIW